MHDNSVKIPNPFRAMSNNESLNFFVTNRIPRVMATLMMGKVSRIKSPLLTKAMIGVWGQFSHLDTESTEERRYKSLRDFFTRGLKPNARPIDPQAIWTSPSDGIAGASGTISNGQLLQIKGMPYALSDLLQNEGLARSLEGGQYLTIRLTSGMYHRFHAPCDLQLNKVTYISGDAFNVNPPTLKRIPYLFCRNERAVLHCTAQLPDGSTTDFYIVAVAAVLVASIRLHALGCTFTLNYGGATERDCDYQATKGDELGWFEQGSTLVMLWPENANYKVKHLFGAHMKMGEAL